MYMSSKLCELWNNLSHLFDIWKLLRKRPVNLILLRAGSICLDAVGSDSQMSVITRVVVTDNKWSHLTPPTTSLFNLIEGIPRFRDIQRGINGIPIESGVYGWNLKALLFYETYTHSRFKFTWLLALWTRPLQRAEAGSFMSILW